MLRSGLVTLSLLFAAANAGAQSTDYQQRWVELSEQSVDSGRTQQVEVLETFFGISPPDTDNLDEGRQLFEEMSDEGWQIVSQARRGELGRIVDELNCGKLAIAKLCQIMVDNPEASASFIAEQKAAIHELALERKLNRYNAAFEQLSDADKAIVASFNEVIYGHASPATSRDYRDRLLTIAREYPEDFMKDQRTECALERADDGNVLVLPQMAASLNALPPLERCLKTEAYARDLMLVCPENFDPQDADRPCDALRPDAEPTDDDS